MPVSDNRKTLYKCQCLCNKGQVRVCIAQGRVSGTEIIISISITFISIQSMHNLHICMLIRYLKQNHRV